MKGYNKMDDTYCEVKTCRSCNAPLTKQVVSLGTTPLANSLLKESQLTEKEGVFPLDLYLCTKCSLVQIKHTVSPNILFKNYFYFSSYSDTMLESAKNISHKMIKKMNLTEDSLVIELASNDGYLLQYYLSKKVPVLGIDPATNIAEAANQKGIPTLPAFFSKELAQKLAAQNKFADVLHANNVLAHVAELKDFVEGVKILLKPTGVAVIEVPYLVDMIENNEFDTIYHEHLCYFSLSALKNLFAQFDLKVIDVEKLSLHGGSLRLFISHVQAEEDPRVQEMLEFEERIKISSPSYYEEFARNIIKNKNLLITLLKKLKESGKTIAAYGASAKGSTLLNVFGINTELIDFVVDRSTAKQGYYTPGSHLPIYAPEKLLEKMPDYVLLLTWNFKKEILAQQSAYLEKGGKFITPVPFPEVI